MDSVIEGLEPNHADRVDGLTGILLPFNQAGVLSAADVHGARRLARLTGCTNESALLGAAFAIRAPRFGHVFAELGVLPSTVTDEDGRAAPLDPAAWPDVDAWVAAVRRSPLVAGSEAPLHLHGDRLYLDRYWRHEDRAADLLAARSDHPFGGSSSPLTLSADGQAAVVELFADNAGQAAAAAAVLGTRFAVIAGGPGTGKTATAARLVGLIASHATVAGRPPRVAVVAPTGKAAARLGEALREAVDELADSQGVDGGRVGQTTPMTLHRLLGSRRSSTRFTHDASNPLPVDVVILDEVSMVSLSMLTHLLQAVPPSAVLVFVGDPDQLASVEAGSVLGDIIAAAATTPLTSQVITLDHNYRNDEGITRFAQALRVGDADAALAQLADAGVDAVVRLIQPDRPGQWPSGEGALAVVRDLLHGPAQTAMDHARAGDHRSALASSMSAKVLCAHRRGPDGVNAWNAAVEAWIMDMPWYHRPEWYAGRPVMAGRNDYDLEVFNGDIGVVVQQDGQLRVVFDGRSGDPVQYRRLGSVQTVHAMTVHKSQGSQFDDVVVVLPHEPSPILTRELLYTAVTRARRTVTIVGSEASLRHAIDCPVTRASALADRLRARLTV